jgi:hypothetical protein
MDFGRFVLHQGARGTTRIRSVAESDLPEERAPAPIGVQRPKKRIDLRPRDPRIVLGARSLEPLERRIGVSSHRVHLRNLIGGIAGVLRDELAERYFRFANAPRGMLADC